VGFSPTGIKPLLFYPNYAVFIPALFPDISMTYTLFKNSEGENCLFKKPVFRPCAPNNERGNLINIQNFL